MADDDFDRDLYDHNADYIDRFALAYAALDLPLLEQPVGFARVLSTL